MQPITIEAVQEQLNAWKDQDVYIHLETTNGAYASHHNDGFFSAGAFLRNVQLRFELGKITGNGPFRVGLKLAHGWLYAEGLTDWTVTHSGQLLLAGHDFDGKLAVALQFSRTPFL